MMAILSAIAIAEVDISGTSILDSDTNTWTQHVFANYQDIEGQPDTSINLILRLGCEDMTAFNSANPTHHVGNVSMLVANYKRDNIGLLASFNWSVMQIAYGCSSGNPSCDTSNTPALIDYPFTLKKGENIAIDLKTYFNTTNGLIDDSPCTFGVEFDSRNCDGCSGKSFQEVTKEIEEQQSTFQVKNTIFNYVNTAIGYNFEIWAILYYIIIIGVFIGSIVGIIYIIFWIYFYLRNNFFR